MASLTFSSSLLPFHSNYNASKAATFTISKTSHSPLCAFTSRPRRNPNPKSPPSRSSSSSRSKTLAPKKPPIQPPPLPKKKHWKVGEFPGVIAESSLPPRRGTPIKNLKKKLDDREVAKAWVPTVTETLADKIEKKQWWEALVVRISSKLAAFCAVMI